MMEATMEVNVLIDEGFEGCPEASWLEGVTGQVLAAQGINSRAELGLVIVGQEKIRQLNLSYLGKDEPTDVLAFSMLPEQSRGDLTPFVAPPDGVKHLGEVIISYPQAVIQAEENRHPVEREIAILIIHGVLHLLGFDHDKPEEEQEMRAREAEILKAIEEGLK
jgi:probable rRNA maturation factor